LGQYFDLFKVNKIKKLKRCNKNEPQWNASQKISKEKVFAKIFLKVHFLCIYIYIKDSKLIQKIINKHLIQTYKSKLFLLKI